jgi:predicted ABC-type ATPase
MSEEPRTKRMRVFAGPNGSGKSTIIKEIQKLVNTGFYINADDIEKSYKEKGFVNLGDFELESTQEDFDKYLQRSTLLAKVREENRQIDLSLTDNVIKIGQATSSYEAALIADYLRQLFIARAATFSFETVMSHPSKLETFRKAQEAGFKNYLYFISTESADINVRRVEERVQKGGHNVATQKIVERYSRSMELLSDMIPYCHRCFIFDNSLETNYSLIAEIVDNTDVIIHTDDEIPEWVEIYVFAKLGV